LDLRFWLMGWWKAGMEFALDFGSQEPTTNSQQPPFRSRAPRPVYIFVTAIWGGSTIQNFDAVDGNFWGCLGRMFKGAHEGDSRHMKGHFLPYFML